MFDSPEKLALGFFTGLVFGFLLQKGRVAKYPVILSQLLLKDWTVAKIMATAIVVGSAGVYALQGLGWASIEVKPAAFSGVIVGALCFGIGMAVLGLCPGTAVAACGEGRRDAVVGVAGMLAGAMVYVAGYSAWQRLTEAWGDMGKVTLPQVTHTSPWLWIALLCGIALAAFLALGGEGWRRRQAS